MTTAMNIPDSLEPVRGPFDFERVDDGVASLGPFGITTRSLVGAGVAPPDLLMGMTLALLAGQPRAHRAPDDDRASPIEGGVWVREQVTIHRPVRLDERWTVNGGTAQRFVRKGRRYGVTVAETIAADGEVLVSNRTTGLLSYQADELAVRPVGRGPGPCGGPISGDRRRASGRRTVVHAGGARRGHAGAHATPRRPSAPQPHPFRPGASPQGGPRSAHRRGVAYRRLRIRGPDARLGDRDLAARGEHRHSMDFADLCGRVHRTEADRHYVDLGPHHSRMRGRSCEAARHHHHPSSPVARGWSTGLAASSGGQRGCPSGKRGVFVHAAVGPPDESAVFAQVEMAAAN